MEISHEGKYPSPVVRASLLQASGPCFAGNTLLSGITRDAEVSKLFFFGVQPWSVEWRVRQYEPGEKGDGNCEE